MLKKILGYVITGCASVWIVLNSFASATTLWPDLYDFWRAHMMGDPWMPWALMFCGVAVLAWTYFPAYRSLFAKEALMNDEKKSVNQSVNIGTMSGGNVSPVYNNQFNTIVAPGRAELSAHGIDQLALTIGRHALRVTIVGDQKCQAIGEKTVQQLQARGVRIERVSSTGVMAPPPSDPYSLQLNDETAYLTISPATLP